MFSRCRIVGNRGRRARAIYATALASVTLRDSLVADNEAVLSDVSLSGSGHYLVERSSSRDRVDGEGPQRDHSSVGSPD